ncbi:HTH-type transcriptional regulator MalT [bacterium HR29]|nr:HTH-type transcriptional regulator MalT [bacterium HR29]
MSLAIPTAEGLLPGAGRVPRLPRDLLPRPRLIDRLHAAIGSGLIVVQAPAGYGKTTLLASFVSDSSLQFEPIWLTADATCRTQEGFADRFAAAALGADAWAPVSITLGEDYRSYLAAVLHRWRERCDRPPIIVLDALEELGADAPAWALVDWLAEAVRDWGELALVSREPIARRALDRRLASGESLVLGPNELRFTAEELEELCRRREAAVDPQELLELTGGWPVAVMSILRGAVPLEGARRALAGSTWDRYLLAEVWRSVPSPLRPVLLRLALLPACEPDVAVAVVGSEAWEAAARWAQEVGLMAEPHGRGGLRLLPPLRDFLRHEFGRVDPAGMREASRLAVEAYLFRGNAFLALATATELRAEEEVERVLRSHARELIERGAFDLLTRAFALVRAERLEGDAVLRGLRARAWSLGGDARQALEEGRALAEDPCAPAEARFHGLLAAVRAARLLGRQREALDLLQRAAELAGQLDTAAQRELAWYEAHTLLALNSEFSRAERLLLSVAQAEMQGPLALLAQSALGQSLGMRGDIPRAIECLSKAAVGWRALESLGNLPWVLNNLSMAHLAAGDTASSVEAAKAALAAARAARNRRACAYAMASLGDALLADGAADAAVACYRKALDECQERVADEALAAMVIAGLSAASLARGDLVQADVYAKRANLIAETLGSPYELAVCRLQAGMLASAAGNHVAALAACDEAVALTKRIEAFGLLRQALYRRAMAAFRAGKRAAAEADVHELATLLEQPWQAAAVALLAREDPLFAQWAASRDVLPPFARERLRTATFAAGTEPDPGAFAPYPSIRVESLGKLIIYKEGHVVPEAAFASAKAIEFFLLFLARREGLAKEQAVVELYPDLPPARCNSAFHSNLYRVRKALYPECIVKRGHTYLLNPDGEFVWDVDEFRRTLEAARQAPAGSRKRAELFEEAVRRYHGPFAATVQSEWAATLRAELDRGAVEALATLAGFHAARGEFETAAGYLERVLAADPLNDEAAYHLARFRAQGGNAMAALAVIDRFAEVLRRELGEELPERLRRLRRAIATGAAS